jgi:hypothetical protein
MHQLHSIDSRAGHTTIGGQSRRRLYSRRSAGHTSREVPCSRDDPAAGMIR